MINSEREYRQLSRGGNSRGKRKKTTSRGGGGATGQNRTAGGATFQSKDSSQQHVIDERITTIQHQLINDLEKERAFFDRVKDDVKAQPTVTPGQRTVYNAIANGTVDYRTVDMRTINALEAKGLITIEGRRSSKSLGYEGLHRDDITALRINPAQPTPLTPNAKRQMRQQLKREMNARIDIITNQATRQQQAIKREHGIGGDKSFQPMKPVKEHAKGLQRWIRMTGSIQMPENTRHALGLLDDSLN